MPGYGTSDDIADLRKENDALKLENGRLRKELALRAAFEELKAQGEKLRKENAKLKKQLAQSRATIPDK